MRRFHQPTGLTAATLVCLVIEELNTPAQIELNGTTIGQALAGQTARLDITAYLKPQNLLAITLTDPQPQVKSSAEGPFGLVSLEIEEPSA